jgi:maltooligosyltrehalose trehalohydrolase
LRRGAFTVACNLGTEAVSVPVTGEVVLASGEVGVAADGTRLGGHSFAILRVSPIPDASAFASHRAASAPG